MSLCIVLFLCAFFFIFLLFWIVVFRLSLRVIEQIFVRLIDLCAIWLIGNDVLLAQPRWRTTSPLPVSRRILWLAADGSCDDGFGLVLGTDSSPADSRTGTVMDLEAGSSGTEPQTMRCWSRRPATPPALRTRRPTFSASQHYHRGGDHRLVSGVIAAATAMRIPSRAWIWSPNGHSSSSTNTAITATMSPSRA